MKKKITTKTTQTISLQLDFREDLEQVLRQRFPLLQDFRILSQSLDARGASRGKPPVFLFKVEIRQEGESYSPYDDQNFPYLGPLDSPPLIVGAGPAGLFCALRLAEYGIPSIIFERGDSANQRMLKIAKFWRYGDLDPESNVCYGEGGAGLFSDGKLMTRIKSPHISYVMNSLVKFGAPPHTAYMADPHLGSNKIRKVMTQLSAALKEKGCDIHYNTRVEKFLFEEKKVVGVELQDGRKFLSPYVILATGHSAKEIYYQLHEKGIAMKAKSFSVGVRIEHARKYINAIQYGPFEGDPRLGTARYRLSFENKNLRPPRGTYSFCMCPGGYVLSSGTDKDGIVINGMSNFARNSPWSNSALVVTVAAGMDFAPPSVSPLQGLQWQYDIEKAAFQWSSERGQGQGREIPAMTLKEFVQGKVIEKKNLPPTSCPSGVVKAPLNQILPSFVNDHLVGALENFERHLPGYRQEEALLLAPETRTSSPVTIVRDPETLESVSHEGLYPCGEGAGYAGGITSAAVDGIRVALSLLKKAKGEAP